MKNKKFKCDIKGNGKKTILKFNTTIGTNNGSSYLGQYGSIECYEPDYSETNYVFEINIIDFYDLFCGEFAMENEDFDFDKFLETATQNDINAFLDSYEGDIIKAIAKINEEAQWEFDNQC